MNNNSNGGIGILGLLGVVFVTLKLIGIIDWSWWYVTMPFWIPFAIAFVLFSVYLIILMVQEFTKGKR